MISFHFILDIMELKRMMEKLGQAKTHLELKKMIAEVDTTNSGSLLNSRTQPCTQSSFSSSLISDQETSDSCGKFAIAHA